VNAPGRPLPTRTPLTAALSQALGESVHLQQCTSCGSFIYYPRVACPECLSDALEWRPLSGFGELLTFGVVWRSLHPAFSDRLPLQLGAVRLREGPVVLALLDDVLPEDIAIGAPVRLVGVDTASGLRLPCFVPA